MTGKFNMIMTNGVRYLDLFALLADWLDILPSVRRYKRPCRTNLSQPHQYATNHKISFILATTSYLFCLFLCFFFSFCCRTSVASAVHFAHSISILNSTSVWWHLFKCVFAGLWAVSLVFNATSNHPNERYVVLKFHTKRTQNGEKTTAIDTTL